MSVDMVRCSRDRGPWLYRERRISRGREFDLLKFRTLRRDVLASMSEDSHARMLEADESNLTWAGRRLLKPWYLDELPQLWNVLRGDMSLVGPRPWPPAMVETQVARGLTYRNELVAGWTGTRAGGEGRRRIRRLRGARPPLLRGHSLSQRARSRGGRSADPVANDCRPRERPGPAVLSGLARDSNPQGPLARPTVFQTARALHQFGQSDAEPPSQ